MKKWEHKIIIGDVIKLNVALQTEGLSGWELCSVIYYEGGRYNVFFKRGIIETLPNHPEENQMLNPKLEFKDIEAEHANMARGLPDTFNDNKAAKSTD